MALNKRGFTLIELLLVIAVIGILAGIILAGGNSSRIATKDARIKATMTQVRLTAQSMRNGSDNNTFSTKFVSPFRGAGCIIDNSLTEPDEIAVLGRDILKLNGVTNCGSAAFGSLYINVVGTAFAATAKLASGTFWCVDSLGADKGGYASASAALDTGGTDTACN